MRMFHSGAWPSVSCGHTKPTELRAPIMGCLRSYHLIPVLCQFPERGTQYHKWLPGNVYRLRAEARLDPRAPSSLEAQPTIQQAPCSLEPEGALVQLNVAVSHSLWGRLFLSNPQKNLGPCLPLFPISPFLSPCFQHYKVRIKTVSNQLRADVKDKRVDTYKGPCPVPDTQ